VDVTKRSKDVFVIVMNFISINQEAKHVTIGLFKLLDPSNVVMVPKL
jgi:hypothetical protein